MWPRIRTHRRSSRARGDDERGSRVLSTLAAGGDSADADDLRTALHAGRDLALSVTSMLRLISQNRNSINDVLYGPVGGPLTSVAPGSGMTLVVGESYDIQLRGGTATH